MSSSRQRARDLLPNVLLTLLSIVQALALETFWERFLASDYLWMGGWPAWIGWVQVTTIVLGIIEIWLFYVSVILRFSWVPGVRDMVLPFFIGILEFILVELQGIERVGPWLVCLAATFALVGAESHLLFRNARRDPANRAFFERLAPAESVDLIRLVLPVVAILALAVAVMATGNQAGFALGCLLAAFCAMAWQIVITVRYWTSTITAVPDE